MQITTVSNLSNDFIGQLFVNAEILRKRWDSPKGCEGKIMATLFLEPSTRTRLSFESAMLRCGGQVIAAPEADSTSVAKGESLVDTMNVIGEYADVMVVRTPYSLGAWGSPLHCHVINAGDGPFNHPTQAMLDAYTIWRELGMGVSPVIDGLKIGVVGDLSKSRTINSFLQLMSRGEDNHFFLYDSTRSSCKVSSQLWGGNINYIEDGPHFQKCLPLFDVLYLNRIQKERWEGETEFNPFQLTDKHVEKMRKTCLILNPGPRQEELPNRFDDLPNNKMLAQVQNGVFLRIALLRKLFQVG